MIAFNGEQGKCNWGDMRKIQVTRQFFEGSSPQGHLFEKKKIFVFRYGLRECVYQISDLYRFLFGQEAGHT